MNDAEAQLQEKLNQAVAHHQTGKVMEAEAAYREILAEAPDIPVVLNNLGLVLLAQGKLDEARASIERAIELEPGYVDAHSNLGNALRHAGDLDGAVKCFRHALALNPDYVQALGNLGNTLLDMGQLTESEDAYRRGLEIVPEQPDLYYNLGRALYEQARWEDAEAAFRKTLSLNHGYPLAHWNLSHVLLLQGRFREAWPEYDWRWHCPGFTTRIPDLGKPRWNGDDIAGKSILVFAEQGFGDTIQFARYLPMLADAGATVNFLCQPELERLLGTVEGIQEITSNLTKLPAYDVFCPLITLPFLLGTDEEKDVPAAVPYVTPPEDGPSAPDGDGLKVGLAWAGRATHGTERQRSLDLDAFRPLLEVPGCRFISLQEGERRGDIGAAGLDRMIADPGDDVADFADTGRLIMDLDLVIAVDTAVAHLAGALNKPVWTLLPKICDWRWMLDRADSPWYPSMRLFRQTEYGDWQGVMDEVTGALTEQAG